MTYQLDLKIEPSNAIGIVNSDGDYYFLSGQDRENNLMLANKIITLLNSETDLGTDHHKNLVEFSQFLLEKEMMVCEDINDSFYDGAFTWINYIRREFKERFLDV